jgi:hypothetical protein
MTNNSLTPKDVAIGKPAQPVPIVASDVAISLTVPFEVVQSIVERCPAPRRPNRNRPRVTPELEAEMNAWEAASDEDFEKFERELE